jgi:O-antigen/teichoic acid export membrane protein
MSANLFNQAIGFISSLFVVRFLRPEELAEARVIAVYVGYVQIVGSLGLATSVLTFVPRSSEPGIRRHWLQVTLLIMGGATAGFSILAAWLSLHGWLMSNAHTAYWFRWSLLGGLATSATGILIAFYQAERAIRKLAGVQSVLRVMVLPVIVGGAWIGGFIGYVVAGIAASFLMLGGLVATLPRAQRFARRVPLPIGYMGVAGLALLANFLWTVGRTVNVVVLDRVATDRVQFGCYSLAISIGMIMSLIISTIQIVAIPFFSAHHDDGEWVLLNARKWQLAGAIVGAIGAAVVFCVAAPLIKFVYGRAYAEAIAFLIPVLVAQVLLATFHIQAAALIGMNLVRVNTIVAAVVVPLSVLAAIIMASRYGVWGAAWSQVLAYTVYAGLQSIWGWAALSRKAETRRHR